MNNARFPRVRASTKAAHEIYHNNTYLMTKDIKELAGLDIAKIDKSYKELMRYENV